MRAGTGPADSSFMEEALRLAMRGVGRTSPNPAVGALVVRHGRVVGRGFHRRAGGPHAEVFALREAGRRAHGATLYVTLEPCCHFGRTPPCVDAVLAAGIERVVVGASDPNPQVSGRGVARLRGAGVVVEAGVLEAECRAINRDFEKYILTGLPYVVLKLAATIDGRIATASGDSQWVTGPTARRRVHELRNRLDAILVGSETVRRDDPALTCRIPGGRDPLRVVLDGRLRVSGRSRVFREDPRRARLYTLDDTTPKALRLRRSGVTVCRGGGDRPGSLTRVLRDLARAGVKSVLVEGGGTIAARALRERLVDRLVIFVAPKLLGAEGRSMIGNLGISQMSQAIRLESLTVEPVGSDWLLEGAPVFRRSR